MKIRILLAAALGCLALVVVPGSAMAGTLGPPGPFKAVSGKATFELTESSTTAPYMTITCTSSTLPGTVVTSTELLKQVVPGVPTFGGCTPTSAAGWRTASISATVAPTHWVFTSEASPLIELKLHGNVEGCTFDITGGAIAARYPATTTITSLPFRTEPTGLMRVTNVSNGTACPFIIRNPTLVRFAGTYTINPGLTITNP